LQQEVYEKFESRQKDLLTVSGVSQQDYDYALNQLNSVKADIQLIKSNLSKTKIAAPFDGVIGLKMVSQGAYLAPNTLIATVQSIMPMKIEFSLPEKYRTKIRENSIIHFTTESAEGLFEGKIYAFETQDRSEDQKCNGTGSQR
jgi:membrane fusion protein (multidrug efflux system)